MKLTPAQQQALQIVRDHGPITPHWFARRMWPQAEAWQNHTRCGRGTTKGGGMNLAAGAFLGKLRQKGWVKMRYHEALLDSGRIYREGYVLTAAGEQVLAAADTEV